jgi:hypothetical protein
MRILVENRRIEFARDILRERFGSHELLLEGFDAPSWEIPSNDYGFLSESESTVLLFCDGAAGASSELRTLAGKILDRPDDVFVAVRYPEIAEYLRGFEVHADIIAIDYSVQGVCEAVDAFLFENVRPRIVVLGGKTDWTEGTIREFQSRGFAVEDLTFDSVDARFKSLLIGGAYEAIFLESLAELETIERRAGACIEEVSRTVRMMTSSPTLKLHLGRRGVISESLVPVR